MRCCPWTSFFPAEGFSTKNQQRCKKSWGAGGVNSGNPLEALSLLHHPRRPLFHHSSCDNLAHFDKLLQNDLCRGDTRCSAPPPGPPPSVRGMEPARGVTVVRFRHCRRPVRAEGRDTARSCDGRGVWAAELRKEEGKAGRTAQVRRTVKTGLKN